MTTCRSAWPFPLPLIVSVIAAAALCALIAVPALRVSGHYLVVVSLALQIIVVAGHHQLGGADGRHRTASAASRPIRSSASVWTLPTDS